MAESRTAIYGAMGANVAIATTKFIVAGITGSSAMLSEGIHSLVDTGNSILLLVGERRSRQAPSAQHPFGYGKELYFWSLIVAVLIFGVGGGVSFYEGALHVRDPHPLEDAHWSYITLAAAAVFEAISFSIAWRAFSRERGNTPVWQALRGSKDPAVYTVLAEDGAALLGLAVAAIGVFCSQALQMPRLDGAASMVIGLLLAGVAVLLIRESRGLLVGEGIRPETVRAIEEIARGEQGVQQVGRVLSMYIGAEEALVTFDVVFAPDVSAADASAAIRRIEAAIRQRFPKLRRICIEPVSQRDGSYHAPHLSRQGVQPQARARGQTRRPRAVPVLSRPRRVRRVAREQLPAPGRTRRAAHPLQPQAPRRRRRDRLPLLPHAGGDLPACGPAGHGHLPHLPLATVPGRAPPPALVG